DLFAIEQTDTDETQAEVARRLGVVAGQDAKASGGNGQRLVETELGGEIRDRVLEQLWRVFAAPGLALPEVSVEVLEHGAHLTGKIIILEADAQFVLGNFVQNRDGVVIEVLPAPG